MPADISFSKNMTPILSPNSRTSMPHFHLFPSRFGARSVDSGSDGFALVIALSLMAFVLLLLLSISTLVRVEQVGANTACQRMKAEQAALLSLNMAIGKLQETAGLDQRVTAPAAAVASVNGPKQLTGVWRSWEGNDHDKTTGLPSMPNYDSKLSQGDLELNSSEDGRFLCWLVSSAYDSTNEISYQAGADSPPLLQEVSGTTVPLVSTGSVVLGTDPLTGDSETAADVEVHLTPTVLADGDAAIAWWISGENSKALIQGASEEPEDDSGWSQRLASYGRADPELFGLDDDVDFSKVNSLRSLDLTTVSSDSVSQDYFHSMTAYSRGLLTNTANGGWRRDLSLMAEKWNEGTLLTTALPVFTAEPFADELESSLRLKDNPGNAAIYPWVTEDNISMSWHALLDFTSLYKKVQTNPTSGEPYFDSVVTNNSDWVSIMPVFARAHFAFGFDAVKNGSTDEDGNALYRPRFLFKPAITMWNPYNVAIESTILTELRFQDATFSIDLYVTVGEQTDRKVNIQTMISGTGAASVFRFLPNQSESSDHTWKPGESRVYGKPGITGEKTSWNWVHTDPGFSIDGSFIAELKFFDNDDAVDPGTSDDVFSYRWEYADVDTSSTLSASLEYTHSRNQTTPDGDSVADDYVQTRMSNSMLTAAEKIPLPDLVNDDETLGSAESEDSPFLIVSVGLRTLLNESDPLDDGSGSMTKLNTKGYINTKPIHPGVELDQSQSAEDCPYAWEFFAPNAWEADPYVPGSDDLFSYGVDHSGYVGTSFQPDYGLNRWIIAELPTQPLLSLGELQHFDISFRNQNPPRVFNAIGNSHASPHIASNEVFNGSISNTSYDHSYVSNHLLFDDWFVSSITPDVEPFTQSENRSIEQVYADHLSLTTPLRNERYLPANPVQASDALSSATAALSEDTAWHDIASQIEVAGMFNINSTSVDAWKALLFHLRGASVPVAEVGDSMTGFSTSPDEWSLELDESAGVSGFPVSRTTVAGDAWSASDSSIASVATHMVMTEEQIDALAIAIVNQVRERGPFLSLSEFINRRLDTDKELAFAGAIESALIELSELGTSNDANPFKEIQKNYPQQVVLPSDADTIYQFKEAAVGNAAGDSAYAAYGTPGWPRQADILRPLAPILSARDDTFLIRAYGDARDISGEVTAQKWCEAVVQRKADYVDSETNTSTDYTNLSDVNQAFGRHFEIVSIRWLTEDEI
jgi:hypothetical protein